MNIEKELLKKLEHYILWAGIWHNIDCRFPFIDQAVCNCNCSKNKNEIKQFIKDKLIEIRDDVVGEEKDTENIDVPKGEDIGMYEHCKRLNYEGYNQKRQEVLDRFINIYKSMDIELYALATAIANENNQTIGEKNDLYITLEQLMDIIKDNCGHECHLTEEYGFVPEAGCPIHDK